MSTSDTTHVVADGSVVDPTVDRDPTHWIVKIDSAREVQAFSFQNAKIGYSSYDPPKGFTTEELVGFSGDSLTLEKARALIYDREEKARLNESADQLEDDSGMGDAGVGDSSGGGGGGDE